MVKVHGQREKPRSVELDGKKLAPLLTLSGLDTDREGWAYDSSNEVVWIKTPDEGTGLKVLIEK